MNGSTAGRRRAGSGRLAVVLGVVLVLAGGALVGWRLVSPDFSAAGTVPPAGPVAAPAAPSTTATSAAGRPAASPTPGRAPRVLVDRSFAPDRLRLTSSGRSAAVRPVEVQPDGGLTVPDDPAVVGWWSGGAAPGSPVGTVVVAGHVDSAESGPGALFELARTPVGSRVVLAGPRGEQTYVVQARRRYLKAQLPWRSLFAQGERPRLVLVTCGGDFDHRTRHYTDNVVVFAVPQGPAQKP